MLGCANSHTLSCVRDLKEMTESEKMGDFVLYDSASLYPSHLFLLFTSKSLETITQSYLSEYACRGLTIALSRKSVAQL